MKYIFVTDICLMKILLNKINLLFIFFLLNITFLFSQTVETIDIEWQKPKTLVQGDQKVIVPSIKGQFLDGYTPNFSWKKELTSNMEYSLSFNLLETAPALVEEINFLNLKGISVGELKYDLSVSKSHEKRYASIHLFPFVMIQGQVNKITRFSISIGAGTPSSLVMQKDFVSNSVLQSGNWYKISVSHDGIYKIDKAFLESIGISTSNLNPFDVHIFGNGDGRLPELNSEPRTDDLAQNAVEVIGGSDGSFDEGDYILFYGWGAHRWRQTSNVFDQDRNPYSDYSYYFITVNSNIPSKQITDLSNSSLPITHSTTSYSFYDVHEVDLKSLVKGGQRWYGELFDIEMDRTFNFYVPNIISTAPALFEVSIASNATFASGTSQTYSVNGDQIYSSTLPSGAGGGNYKRQVIQMIKNNPSNNIPLRINIVRNSPSVLTYLDRIRLNARASLKLINGQMNFADIPTVGVGNVTEFTLSNFSSSSYVWDVTDRHNPKRIEGVFSGGNFSFIAETDSLRNFVACNGTGYYSPTFVKQVPNQNLHGLSQADYLIITHKDFIAQANRLADLHRVEDGYTVHVVTDEQVFNEFSSGAKDATAIRMFAKMFYDRGALNPSSRPKFLLLFGDGTFDPKDRVSNNNNYILTYQMLNSEDYIAAMVTDDYFGMLDDNESISPNDDLDISVGRLLISNPQMAVQQVNKIEHYMKNGSSFYGSSSSTSCNVPGSSSTFGDWRTKYVQIADDEEGNYFLNYDVEPQYDTVTKNHPSMNCEKIYLDAHTQISTAGGSRYPTVNEAIDRQISNGCLLMNYVGHGGEVGVAEERVITVPMINAWDNINRLVLFVTATCEFTKYDDPDRVSAGEWASINPTGGAIALMTTTRSVYFGVNTNTGRSFFENVFKRDANDLPRTFGDIIRFTKNGVPGSNNKRSFTLIGDPALRIAMPRLNIVTDSINGLAPSVQIDTLSALSKVTIKGHIDDFNGNVVSNFNGFVYPTIYDKVKIHKTLGNDPGSPIRDFETQTNKLYRGKATVKNGYFEFTFVVPKDINYSFGNGKLSYYAEDGTIDAIGNEKQVIIGGVDPNGVNDTEKPELDIYLNDVSFVNGGITDENPILIAKVFDENGINTVGNGVGHDIVAILDNETSKPIILNDYYVSETDSYQAGEIRYNFRNLAPGPHTLSLKVWDVNNNSAEVSVEFVVQESEELQLDHVLNYPNPFTTSTEFFFEHNQVCDQLQVQLQIMTISGRLVKTINTTVASEGFRSNAIHWDGRDDFGDQLAKGVYVYRLVVKTSDGKKAEKLEKLVILK